MNIMHPDTQNAFLSVLEKKLKELTLETSMLPNEGPPQVGDTLRFLLPFDEGEHCYVVTVSVFNMNDEAVLLEFYTVLLTDMGDTLPALRSELISWNYYCPLGSFGVYERERQLYHKHGVVLYEDDYQDLDALAEYGTALVALLYQTVTEKFAPAMELLQGKASCF